MFLCDLPYLSRYLIWIGASPPSLVAEYTWLRLTFSSSFCCGYTTTPHPYGSHAPPSSPRVRKTRLRPGEDVRPDDQRPHPPPHRARATSALGLEGAWRAPGHDEGSQAGVSRLEGRRYADTDYTERAPRTLSFTQVLNRRSAPPRSCVHHLQLHRKLGDDGGTCQAQASGALDELCAVQRCRPASVRWPTFLYLRRLLILQGCKEAGIPCFGTLWDFVSSFMLSPIRRGK